LIGVIDELIMDVLDVVANKETLPIVQLWKYVSWDDMVGANI